MKKLPFILATVIMSLGGFSFAYADTIASQTSDSSTRAQFGMSSDGSQTLGTALSGTAAFVNVYATSSAGIAAIMTVNLLECPSATYSGCTTVASSAGNPVSLVKNIGTATFATPYTLDATKYYELNFANTNGSNLFYLYGSAASTYVNGNYCTSQTRSAGACIGGHTDGFIVDIYFDLQSSGANTASRITGNVSPSNVTDADAAVSLTYSYYSGVPAVTTATYILRDLTVGQSIAGQTTSGLAGNQVFTQALQLTVNRRYSWQPVLNTASTTIYGATYYFNTGSSSPSGASYGEVFTEYLNGNWNALETIDNLTDTNASSSLEGFVNNVYSLQNVLVTKFPFNYFVEIANTLDEILSSSTSTTAYTFAVNFSGNYATSSGASPFSILPTTWTVIAPSTMDVYYPESTRNFFRSLLLTVIVVAWGLMMFNRVRFLFT